MIINVINKILIFIFFMGMLNIIRHAYYFIQASVLSTIENPRKYVLTKQSLIILGASIAYLLTVIINGIKI